MTAGLPANHPLRHALSNEVHARPPARLETPEHVSYLAMLVDENQREVENHALGQLAKTLGFALPALDSGHLMVDTGVFRLKWERHTEFSSYTFFRRVIDGDKAGAGALPAVPTEWIEKLPGKLIVAAHVELRKPVWGEPDSIAGLRIFAGEPLIGSGVGDEAAWVITDFRIDGDGFLRFLLLDRKLSERQAGRMAQRLFEIETYRLMALLAFPLARQVGQFLNRAEAELAQLTERMAAHATGDDDALLLNDLTRIAAQVEQSVATSAFRFGAAQAYYDLVQRRIAELRETRLAGIQTIEEFMERRLAPAMHTCAAIAKRQAELSARIARSSQLLRTRVDIELEQQNQQLLMQMNRRAQLQLRLQQTVEGLSVMAVTYYGAGLVGYLAKAAKQAGLGINPELATGIAVPIIAAVAAFGVHRLRRKMNRQA